MALTHSSLTRQVEQVLLDAGNYQTVPVDVKAVAKSVGLHLETLPVSQYSLMPTYLAVEGKPAFGFQLSVESHVRSRLLIAHAIGHHVLHHTGPVTAIYCHGNQADQTLCPEANLFAHLLLLPAHHLERAIQDHLPDERIAREFHLGHNTIQRYHDAHASQLVATR